MTISLPTDSLHAMKTRLLIVSPTPFLPSDAGNRVRIGNFIDALHCEGVDVYFLHVTREPGNARAMAVALGDGRFRSIPYAKPARCESRVARLGRHLRQIVDVDASHMWGLDDWFDPTIPDAVLGWHREVGFEAVMVEYVFFSALLDRLPQDVLKILDTHDSFTCRHRLYLKQGMAPRFFSTSARDEARGLSRADIVLAIQDREREQFSRMTAKPVITVGHLIRIENCLSLHDSLQGPTLLIVGSENEINVNGLNSFLEEDWPLIRQRLPKSRLLVAGGLSKCVSTRSDVLALGFVQNIADAYRQAHIVVNPVRSSSGLNIKSIEALGYGMPLISTAEGCRGLESVQGQALIRADGPTPTADAIERLWRAPALMKRLSREGQAFAKHWNDNALAELKNILVRSTRLPADI